MSTLEFADVILSTDRNQTRRFYATDCEGVTTEYVLIHGEDDTWSLRGDGVLIDGLAEAIYLLSTESNLVA